MKYYMHVNFLEKVFPTDEIIRRCAAAGYDGIELRNRDSSGKLDVPAYVEHVAKIAADNKLDLVFGGSSAAHDPNPEVRAAALQAIKTLIGAAADAGVKILNVFTGNLASPAQPYHFFDAHGSTIATEEHWRLASEFFAEAGDLAARHAINLCFETHNVYLHDLGEPTARLIDRIGRKNVLANFDYGNMFLNRRSQGLEKEMNHLAGKIGYVHLKNLRGFNHFDSRLYFATPLDEGDINNFVLVRKLLADGYAGPFTIENTMGGDKRPYLTRDLEYLKGIVAELQGSRA